MHRTVAPRSATFVPGIVSQPKPSSFVGTVSRSRSRPSSLLPAAVDPASISSVVSTIADVDVGTVPLAVAGGVALAGLAGAVLVTDPQKRRETQMENQGGDEMEAVKAYFNSEGFSRWKKIYGETDEVNKVQMDIREGHAQTIDKVLKWLDEEGGVEGQTFCDAGCGTGSLSVPLALRGALVSGSDISSAMVGEAADRYKTEVEKSEKAPAKEPVFEAKDLESITGKYDNVACLDVMIHYPQEKADGMIRHLASLAEKKLIISFAPKTLAYLVLKRIGELFPGPSKATRAYLHAESDVEKSLNEAGWKVVKREMTATNFYFSRLLEAERA
ncbi:hypothetical protein BSKO_05194 [Bryopsis sp. KO-2023]|nr:hypothetical protein BSKO_05194 [Bryopsis sp. KO-2023]